MANFLWNIIITQSIQVQNDGNNSKTIYILTQILSICNINVSLFVDIHTNLMQRKSIPYKCCRTPFFNIILFLSIEMHYNNINTTAKNPNFCMHEDWRRINQDCRNTNLYRMYQAFDLVFYLLYVLLIPIARQFTTVKSHEINARRIINAYHYSQMLARH